MRNKSNPSILFIFKLPPPHNGATLSNLQIRNSQILNSQFRSYHVNYGLSRGSNDFGTIRLQKVWFYLRSIFLVKYYLIFFRINLVYITISPKGFSFFKDSLFVFISKIFRKKIVIHLHGKGIRKSAAKSSLIRWYYSAMFKNTKVICLSQGLKNDIQSVYKGDPYIVSNGIPELNISISDKKSGIPKILFLSNLYVRKGILNFLDVIEILHRTGIKFQALIVGNSTNELSIEQLTKIIQERGLQANILVHGPLYGEDKSDVLKSADIFLFPTEWPNEAFPIVLLEAMQYGLPVITSPEGGIPDIIENSVNGFILPASDFEGMAMKIQLLLSDRDMSNKMSYINKQKYQDNYTLTKFENNLISVFNEILLIGD